MTDLQARLLTALSDPDLEQLGQDPVPDTTAEAAYEVAVALGLCRIAGAKLPDELDVTMDAAMFRAAIDFAFGQIDDARETLTHLLGPYGAECDIHELEDSTLWVLETRHELWAAREAFLDSLGSLEPEETRDAQGERYEELLDRLGELDILMLDNAAEFGAAAELKLLDNWRSAVAPGQEMPWWLDGEIEAAAARAWARTRAEMPAAEFWHRVARRRWLPKLDLPLAMAAQQEPRPQIPRLLQWASPDGQYIARMPLPAEVTELGSYVLSVLQRPSLAPAVELANRPIALAGVTSQLDAQGQASFSHRDLWAQGQLPELVVDGQTWAHQTPVEPAPE
jgi:hypothetical protein